MPTIESPPRRVVVGCVVVGVVAAAAILGVLSVSQESTQPVGTNASERVAAIDGVEATVTTTIRRGNRTNRTAREVRMRPNEGQIRSTAVGESSSGPERIVSNGSVMWIYDRDNGTVRRRDATAMRERMRGRGDRIERLFRQAQENGTTDSTGSSADRGISPLPAVPPGGQTPTQPAVSPANGSGAYNVTYEGTGTVDGREVHILQITAEGDGTTEYRNFSQRIWVDAEWYMPLQSRTSWVEDGESVEATVEYSNVSFNPGLSSETFTFEMPDDAALVTPELGTNASERITSLDSISATVITRVSGLGFNGTGENDTYRAVRRVQYRFATGEQRAELVSASTNDTGFANDLLVSNGTVTWIYNRETNNVTVLRTDSTAYVDRQGERIERLFARLNRTRSTADDEPLSIPSPGLSSTAGLETSGMSGSSPSTAQDRYGVSFRGVETIDGRPAYVLEIDAENESASNYSQTMWLDAEYFFPLKQRMQFSSGNNSFSTVTTFTNVTINPEFDDETFEFEVPENATVTDSSHSYGQNHETRAATEANATVPVPEPSVPQEFELAGGRTSSTALAESASLFYRNETSRLTVSVFEFNDSFPENLSENASGGNVTIGENVTIGDTNGTYTDRGFRRSVSWSCDGRQYIVSGRAVSKSLLVEVARSIECE